MFFYTNLITIFFNTNEFKKYTEIQTHFITIFCYSYDLKNYSNFSNEFNFFKSLPTNLKTRMMIETNLRTIKNIVFKCVRI